MLTMTLYADKSRGDPAFAQTIMKVEYKTWEETLPHGPPLCALCMGNDAYVSSSFPALSSSVNDAKAVAAQIENKLGESGAWATDVGNIKDKAAMELQVKNFLRQIRRPPRMVLVYVSGHGVQEGDEIFLVPTHASPSTLEELRAQCLSHDELFRILKTDLEERDVPDQGAECCVRCDLFVKCYTKQSKPPLCCAQFAISHSSLFCMRAA